MASALTRLMGADARQRDWPQLARYRDANRALAKPAAGESRVVFMGDSITDAWPQRARSATTSRPTSPTSAAASAARRRRRC